MRRVKDDLTLDMFLIPQPANPVPGECNYAAGVSELVGQVLKDTDLDRYEVAARMSRLSGDDVSKNMLDAWASPARADHNIPLYRVPLLEHVCESHTLADWLVHQHGGRVAYGIDTLNAEIGRQIRMRDDAARKVKDLQRLLEENKQ